MEKILYRVTGITGTTETILGEEETYADACEVMDVFESCGQHSYDWVGIVKIPIED